MKWALEVTPELLAVEMLLFMSFIMDTIVNTPTK